MSRRIFALALFLLLFSSSAAFSGNAPGILMVKFKPSAVKAASVQALNAKAGVYRVEKLYRKALENRPDWKHLEDDYIVYFPKEKKVEDVAEEYRKDPNVISALPSTIVRAYDTIPNDPYFGNQYGLTNIEAPRAWDRTTGTSGIVIAVLDTGIRMNHEDFDERIDPRSYDFVNEDDDPSDDFGHGTNVAGVIGAVSDNGLGIAGTDWQAKLLICKVLDHTGSGLMADILAGIAYANSLTVEVMNMSFGQYAANLNLELRCQEAYDNGVVLVAAAGNGDVEDVSYPAGYDSVIAVAAVDQNDVRSVWNVLEASNYGSWVDISAPGTNIYTTDRNGGYSGLHNGTSLASPFVAGVAGLVIAANPFMTNQEVFDRIKNTADNIDSLQEPEYRGKLGSGRVNASKAVAGVNASITYPVSGSYLSRTIDIQGTAGGWRFSTYEVIALREGSVESTIKISNLSVEAGTLASWDTAGKNGPYTIRLEVFSTDNNSDEAEVNVYLDNTMPEAMITSPASGENIEGSKTILGTASDQYIDHYLLEYGEGVAPTAWQEIVRKYVPVSAGVLGTWETSGLSGEYVVRLKVYDKVGNVSTQSVPVNILDEPAPDKKVNPEAGLPLTYALPNPFNRLVSSEVTFNYNLNANYTVRIFLFDLSGKLFWQKSYLPGENGGKSGDNNPPWDGKDMFGGNVPAGVYIFQVTADNRVLARGKVIVLN